jgi:hypothetical protein
MATRSQAVLGRSPLNVQSLAPILANDKARPSCLFFGQKTILPCRVRTHPRRGVVHMSNHPHTIQALEKIQTNHENVWFSLGLFLGCRTAADTHNMAATHKFDVLRLFSQCIISVRGFAPLNAPQLRQTRTTGRVRTDPSQAPTPCSSYFRQAPAESGTVRHPRHSRYTALDNYSPSPQVFSWCYLPYF